jgi:hypothetical protein
MPDGSSRTTFATSSGENVNYPSCVKDSVTVLSAEFDRVSRLVTRLLEELTSKEDLQWKSTGKDDKSRNFTDLEKKVLELTINTFAPIPR